jgi:hypothetical protein
MMPNSQAPHSARNSCTCLNINWSVDLAQATYRYRRSVPYTAYDRWSGTGVETPPADEVSAGTAPLHRSVELFERTLWRFTVAIPMSNPRFSTTRMVLNSVAVEHPVVAAATTPGMCSTAPCARSSALRSTLVPTRCASHRPMLVSDPITGRPIFGRQFSGSYLYRW